MNQRGIAPSFILSIACAIAFMVIYILGGEPGVGNVTGGGQTQLEGLTLAGAFGSMGIGIILWAKHLMDNTEVEQDRHHFDSTEEEIGVFGGLIEEHGGDVTRRRLLSGLGVAALGSVGLAAIFPLKSMGPMQNNSLFHTNWKKGLRLVTHDGVPVKADFLEVGSIATVFPEGHEPLDPDAVLLVGVPLDQFKARTGRENWIAGTNVAYSKVCTHVGCPVSLYRATTHELLCPCHQSTFNVLDGGRAVFGPAARSLPQLPLAIDANGYLIAQSDFQEPVGPGFWNRGRASKES